MMQSQLYYNQEGNEEERKFICDNLTDDVLMRMQFMGNFYAFSLSTIVMAKKRFSAIITSRSTRKKMQICNAIMMCHRQLGDLLQCGVCQVKDFSHSK